MLQLNSKITIEQVANGFVVMPGPSYRAGGAMEHSPAEDMQVYQTVAQLAEFLVLHFDGLNNITNNRIPLRGASDATIP